ncbi:hypothetical protein NC651_038415 [Populus alba x Populus x berolinensis]|nr:hypothetical protein NC651_038415 [Populus alba x Populus x berolinensis]
MTFRDILNMPKTSSSKKPTQEQENADVQQAKPSSTLEKSGNEIDDIFSGKKRKKPEQIKADKANVNGEEKPKSMKKKKKKSKEDEERRFTDPPSKSRKKTEDGFSRDSKLLTCSSRLKLEENVKPATNLDISVGTPKM